MNKSTTVPTQQNPAWIPTAFSAWILFSIVVLAGCRAGLPDTATAPIAAPLANLKVGVDPHFHQLPPQRVVLFCSNEIQFGRTKTRQILDSIAAEIRSVGLFEVYAPQHVEKLCGIDEILRGKFSEAEILRLGKIYSADSVMFVRINEASFFNPMSASLTMAIVDVDEALLTFSMDGRWTVQDPTTRSFFEEYLHHRTSESLDPPAAVLHHSPREFINFVANQVALVLKPNCQMQTISQQQEATKPNEWGTSNELGTSNEWGNVGGAQGYLKNDRPAPSQWPDSNLRDPANHFPHNNHPNPSHGSLRNPIRDHPIGDSTHTQFHNNRLTGYDGQSYPSAHSRQQPDHWGGEQVPQQRSQSTGGRATIAGQGR